MQTITLLAGLLIIMLTFWDFFHTTVSGNGFGLISSFINKTLARFILKINSNTLLHYSGFIHVLINVFSLFLLLLLGAFLVFSSGNEMVVHEATKMPASLIDRFYYICYLLSTAGFGNFVPGNDLSNFFSSIFSFAGFIMLTTAMTYIISVINSVLGEKELALNISNLGEDINELYAYFTKDEDFSTLMEKSGDLQQMINRNTSSFTTFPIIRFFLTREKAYSVVLQLVRLYEVLNVLKTSTKTENLQDVKIDRILKSIENYLGLEEKTPLTYSYNANNLKKIRAFWQKHGKIHKSSARVDKAMSNALRKANWDWEDVYMQQQEEDPYRGGKKK